METIKPFKLNNIIIGRHYDEYILKDVMLVGIIQIP